MARSARRPGRQAQVARLLVSAAAAVVAACASVGTPPGGPPDKDPPEILSVKPESGAVVPNFDGDLVIQFDEVVDEMANSAGAGGGTQLSRQVLLSPVAGPVKVSWHRTHINVKPKEGWKKRVYRLQILPGFVDLRRNRNDSSKTVLFTTGPEIGHARIGGIALKWIDQTILLHALIEAVPLPDTIGYLTYADSGGQFNLTNLVPGRYIVYATSDDNGDRRRSPREAYDSALVTLDSSCNVALYTFPHDTNPPRPRAATFVDTMTVRVEFNQALDPTAALDTTHVHVLTLPDSTPLPVAQVLTQRQFDSLTTQARQQAESAAAKKDTSAARRAPPPPPPAPAARGRGAKPPRQLVDTVLVKQLLARRPVPTDRFVVHMVNPLKPEARYVVRVQGATSLLGKKGDGQVGFTSPKPVVADTTHRAPRRAGADTTHDVRRTPP
ncbi:MAG TPA: Ig-like domain-containing protein [Gemmatimonadales bacterium]|nr:Ig-like domain-containing protein [Gemmatimonadales bacterium]